MIVAGLKARQDKGIVPFTVMSCDNIPHNGDVTANAVVGARAAFGSRPSPTGSRRMSPSRTRMVDRITPATGQREIDLAEECLRHRGQLAGLLRRVQAVGAGRQVHRRAGRRSKRSGCTFVPDVTPYEHMKIRILNGGHAAIAYPAALMDIHFVHEAMEDPLIRAFLAKLENDEIIPIVPPVPEYRSLTDYFKLIEHRLLNPKIGDTIPRLAQDGSNRQPKFILPSTLDNLAPGQGCRRPGAGFGAVVPLLLRHDATAARQIVFNDASADRLHAAAREGQGRSAWPSSSSTTSSARCRNQICSASASPMH